MSRTKTSSAIELLVPLDRASPRPLHRQLEHELRDAVRNGRLASGSTMPSTRALAEQLAVSRGIVVEAYEQLAAEGYLVSRPGGATQVAAGARPAPSRAPGPSPIPIAYDFRPGRPDLDLFPRAVWLRSVRRALNEAPSERFGYLDGRGMPELRGALGLEIVEVPVDESGLRVDMLDAAEVDAVVVTAAHQYPTGGVLPPERRS